MDDLKQTMMGLIVTSLRVANGLLQSGSESFRCSPSRCGRTAAGSASCPPRRISRWTLLDTQAYSLEGGAFRAGEVGTYEHQAEVFPP